MRNLRAKILILTIVPVILLSVGLAAVIHIEFSGENILDHAEIARIGMWAVIAVLIIGVSGAIIFTTFITKPIMELTKGVDAVGSGDVDFKVNVKTKDEIGKLSASFNKMVENLKIAKKEITKTNTELEMANIELRMARQRLQLERDKAQNYFDIAEGLIICIDADQLVSLINKRGCEILGYAEDEIVGKNWFNAFIPERIRNEVKVVFEKLIAGEIEPVKYFENPVLTKSGEERIIAWHNSVIKDNEGHIIGTLSSGEDITHRDAAELALRESERKYRNLVDNALVGIYKTNLKGDIIYVNEALAKILEFDSPEEMMKEGVLARYKNQEDREVLIENLMKKGKVEKLELELLTKTGKTKYVILNAIFEGDILSGMILDITERKLIESNLTLFRNLIDSANDAIFVIEPETGRLLDINNMACSTLGCNRDELLNMKIPDIEVVLPGDFYWYKYVDTILEKGSMVLESVYKRKDDTTFPVEINIKFVSLDKKDYFVAVVRDITIRRRIEEQLFQIKQDWEDTFNSITDMITIHDKDYNIMRANKAAEKLLKLPDLEEILNVKCYRHYHGTGAPPEGCPSCNCLVSGQPCSFEIFEPHLNMFIEIRAIPRFDNKNQIVGLIHVVRDITERKEIEQAITKAKIEWEMTVDNATEMIVLADRELNIIRCNKSFAEFAQKPIGQLIGLKCTDFLPYVHEQITREQAAKVEAVTEKGRWLYINFHSIKDKDGKLIYSVFIVTDITALKETEQRKLHF